MANTQIKLAKDFRVTFSVYLQGKWKHLKPEIRYAFVQEFVLTQTMIRAGTVSMDKLAYDIYFESNVKDCMNQTVIGSFQVHRNGETVVVIRKARTQTKTQAEAKHWLEAKAI